MRFWRCIILARGWWAFVAAGLSVAVAFAVPARFNVPAQSAATALVEFARQARVEVLFGSEELKDVKSNPVLGTFEPYVAIEMLLRGTGFTAINKPGGKFVVVRAASPSP